MADTIKFSQLGEISRAQMAGSDYAVGYKANGDNKKWTFENQADFLLNDSEAGQEFQETFVKVQDTEPTDENNKIWIEETPEREVEVPTYDEFEEVVEDVDDLKSAIGELWMSDVSCSIGTITTDGLPNPSTTRIRTDDFIYVNKGVTITATAGSVFIAIAIYDSEKNYITSSGFIVASPSSYTMQQDGYIKILVRYYDDRTFTEAMLAEWSATIKISTECVGAEQALAEHANTLADSLRSDVNNRLNTKADENDVLEIGENFRTLNLLNVNHIIPNKWLNDDGTIKDDSDYSVSDFINISSFATGTSIYYKVNGKYGSGYQARRILAYDASYNVLSVANVQSRYDVVDNGAKYLRFCLANAQVSNKPMVTNDFNLSYVPYYDTDKVSYIETFTKQIANKFNYNMFVENLMIEYPLNSPHAWVKFDSIKLVFNYDATGINIPTYYKLWADITKPTNPDGLWTVPSGTGVTECAFIGGASNYKIVYSMSEKVIKYEASTQYHFNDQLILAELNNGVLTGLLADVYTQNIEKDFYQHRYRITSEQILTEHIKPTLLKAVQNIPDNGFTIGYLSDNHGRNDIIGWPNLTPMYMNAVDKLMNLDAIINCGDIIASSDTYTREDAIYSIGMQNELLENEPKQITVLGNHDQNGHTLHERQELSWTLTHRQFYNLCYRYLANDDSVVWGSKDDLYFYKDFENKKVRVIVLNTQDCGETIVTDNGVDYLKYDSLTTIGIRQAQLTWLANTALNFMDKQNRTDWHTMILAHVGFRPSIVDNAPRVQNYAPIEAVIKAFKNGTTASESYTDTINQDGLFTTSINVDYTTQGQMPFIGVFSGHNHTDSISTEDYPQVTIICGYPSGGYYNVDRTLYTYKEFAFDVVNIDKTNRTVKFTRFGGGSDRSYNY